MKRFIYVIFMTLGLMAITPQNANAQFSGLLRGAIEKGTQAAKNKKAAKEYNALVDAANAAIENHDLRYFCAANRREELRRAAAAAEIDNSDMDYKVQKFLSDETDLNNTDYIASARGLLARSKAEEDIPTSNYLLKCAKIQYNTELEKFDLETIPELQKLYEEIIAYENTFTNGRNKGAEILNPSQISEALAEKRKEDEASNYEKMDWSTYKDTPTNTSSSSSQSNSDSKAENGLEGEYPDLYNNNHDWKDNDNNFVASVAQDGSIYRSWGNRDKVCQIKKNGEIYVQDRLWGQVMKDSRYFIIYQYDRYSNNKPVRKGTVEYYGNGTVIWDYQTMGKVGGYAVENRNGKAITSSNTGNTTYIHRAVALLLYDKFRW